jgi:hypothetical protein
MGTSLTLRHVVYVAAALAAVIFAGFVWPTPYQHYKSGSLNLRVNRFTGTTQRLTVHGWQATPPLPSTDPVADYLARIGDSLGMIRRMEELERAKKPSR